MIDFKERLKLITDAFSEDSLYQACMKEDTLSEWRIFKKYSKKTLDTEWLDVIEDALPHLDVIVRNPRRFIVVEEDLVDTSRARSVSEESVKHLAQHTNFIHGIDKERDMVLPSKLLNTTKEESYEVYENRFIFTLLKRLQAFIKRRYDAVMMSSAGDDHVKLVVDKGMKFTEANVTLRLDSVVKMPFEKAVKLSAQESAPIERLTKIYSVVMGFMLTPFAKEMNNSAPVRPPIQRTNVILKNQDFKKALALWEFLQGYDKEGFEIKPVTQIQDMDDELKSQYRLIVYLNSLFAQQLAGATLTDAKTPDAEGEKEQTFDPDAFPESDIPLEEVKYIAVPTALDDRFLSDVNKAEINSALDRIFAQHKLNVAKEGSRDKIRKIIAQRKMEEETRDKIVKLRKKERDLLAKLEKENEKERLRHEADIAEIAFEKATKDQLKQFEKEMQKLFEEDIEVENRRLTAIAVAEAKKEAGAEFTAEELSSRIDKQKSSYNAMRRKLKAMMEVKLNAKIDEVISKIPQIYNNEEDV